MTHCAIRGHVMREFRAVRRILNLDTRATAILLGSKKSVETYRPASVN